MIIDKLFALMAEKKASDIFITVGTPIHIKIDGNTVPINQQAMDPKMIHLMAYEMMTPEQVERFETTREMNLSFGRRDMGNFRINIFWQRNSIAIVVRYIAGDIPKLDNLGLANPGFGVQVWKDSDSPSTASRSGEYFHQALTVAYSSYPEVFAKSLFVRELLCNTTQESSTGKYAWSPIN